MRTVCTSLNLSIDVTDPSFTLFGAIYYCPPCGGSLGPDLGKGQGRVQCFGGKEDTAIGRYALSVTLIVTVSQPGVGNVTGTR